MLICRSISAIRRHIFWRYWRKLRHLLEQIRLLGSEWQEGSCQSEVEERAMKKVRTRDLTDERFVPLIYYLHRLSYPNDPGNFDKLESTLVFVRVLRGQPFRLSDLYRISIQTAKGGKHFQASVIQLPLPTTMKEIVLPDLFPHFLDVYRI